MAVKSYIIIIILLIISFITPIQALENKAITKGNIYLGNDIIMDARSGNATITLPVISSDRIALGVYLEISVMVVNGSFHIDLVSGTTKQGPTITVRPERIETPHITIDIIPGATIYLRVVYYSEGDTILYLLDHNDKIMASYIVGETHRLADKNISIKLTADNGLTLIRSIKYYALLPWHTLSKLGIADGFVRPSIVEASDCCYIEYYSLQNMIILRDLNYSVIASFDLTPHDFAPGSNFVFYDAERSGDAVLFAARKYNNTTWEMEPFSLYILYSNGTLLTLDDLWSQLRASPVYVVARFLGEGLVYASTRYGSDGFLYNMRTGNTSIVEGMYVDTCYDGSIGALLTSKALYIVYEGQIKNLSVQGTTVACRNSIVAVARFGNLHIYNLQNNTWSNYTTTYTIANLTVYPNGTVAALTKRPSTALLLFREGNVVTARTYDQWKPIALGLQDNDTLSLLYKEDDNNITLALFSGGSPLWSKTFYEASHYSFKIKGIGIHKIITLGTRTLLLPLLADLTPIKTGVYQSADKPHAYYYKLRPDRVTVVGVTSSGWIVTTIIDEMGSHTSIGNYKLGPSLYKVLPREDENIIIASIVRYDRSGFLRIRVAKVNLTTGNISFWSHDFQLGIDNIGRVSLGETLTSNRVLVTATRMGEETSKEYTYVFNINISSMTVDQVINVSEVNESMPIKLKKRRYYAVALDNGTLIIGETKDIETVLLIYAPFSGGLSYRDLREIIVRDLPGVPSLNNNSNINISTINISLIGEPTVAGTGYRPLLGFLIKLEISASQNMLVTFNPMNGTGIALFVYDYPYRIIGYEGGFAIELPDEYIFYDIKNDRSPLINKLNVRLPVIVSTGELAENPFGEIIPRWTEDHLDNAQYTVGPIWLSTADGPISLAFLGADPVYYVDNTVSLESQAILVDPENHTITINMPYCSGDLVVWTLNGTSKVPLNCGLNTIPQNTREALIRLIKSKSHAYSAWISGETRVRPASDYNRREFRFVPKNEMELRIIAGDTLKIDPINPSYRILINGSLWNGGPEIVFDGPGVYNVTVLYVNYMGLPERLLVYTVIVSPSEAWLEYTFPYHPPETTTPVPVDTNTSSTETSPSLTTPPGEVETTGLEPEESNWYWYLIIILIILISIILYKYRHKLARIKHKTSS